MLFRSNPWNIERTSGGSSGGAAAAVAAGLTPLELGSDIGGSIRTPSHFNGVFGHKSSYGVIPQRGHLPPGEHTLSETDLDVIGPIGTCVSDLRAAMNLLAGPLPEDAPAWSVSLPEPDFKSPEELRIAVWADDAECRVDKEIVGAIRQAAESLAQQGAKVD